MLTSFVAACEVLSYLHMYTRCNIILKRNRQFVFSFDDQIAQGQHILHWTKTMLVKARPSPCCDWLTFTAAIVFLLGIIMEECAWPLHGFGIKMSLPWVR